MYRYMLTCQKFFRTDAVLLHRTILRRIRMKKYIVIAGIILVAALALFIYIRFFFTYEQRNKIQRSVETVTGQKPAGDGFST